MAGPDGGPGGVELELSGCEAVAAVAGADRAAVAELLSVGGLDGSVPPLRSHRCSYDYLEGRRAR